MGDNRQGRFRPEKFPDPNNTHTMNRRRMSAILMPALLFTGLLVAAGGAEEIDPGKITTLTVEQVQNLKPKGDSMRFGKLAELTPEVAAALASQKMELEFTAVENPSVEAIKALAGHKAGLSFPKIAGLSPGVARALAGYEGTRLSLNGLATLSPEVARVLADYDGHVVLKNGKQPGSLALDGVKELSAEAAAALANSKAALRLNGLTSLTSIPLAEKLGSQIELRLQSLAAISDEMAKALFLSPKAPKGTGMSLGLKQLSVEAAKALGERGRTVGGHWVFHELETMPDEVAEALSARAALRCWKVTKLSDRAAKALNQFFHVHMYALSDVSNEALEMFSKRHTFIIHGLKKLDCVPFAATLMSNNSDFLDLNQLETISDEAADALAMDCRRTKLSVVPLPSLKSLNSVALAEVLAEGTLPDPRAPRGAAQEARRRKGRLALSKLEVASDAVVRVLATHEGPLSLGLKSLSVEAAKALARREAETALGTQELSDEAARALAEAKGRISLPGLTKISEASAAALRKNAGISLPK